MIAATKRRLHYRKIGEQPKNCWQCGHRRYIDIIGIGGDVLRQDYRCEHVGLGSSIKYAIRRGHVCDKFAYFPQKK